MDAGVSGFIIIAIATYLLTAATLLAYKAALNDFYYHTRRQVFLEIRAVHPIALLAAFVSLAPTALVRIDTDNTTVTWSIMAGVTIYLLIALWYRNKIGHKLSDFSIDNGSNFNDEISADPTVAQKVWLFLVSWAGGVVLGTFYGFLVSYGSWRDDLSVLTDQPTDIEAQVYLYIFLGLFVLSLVSYRVLRNRRLRKLPTSKRLRRAVTRTWFVPSIFGLIIAFLQVYTRNAILTNRYWTILIFTWIILMMCWAMVFVIPNTKRHLEEDRQFFEAQQKRLRRQRNKRRKKNRR